ncbi:MAG: hypothetical protein WC455_23290 [Dehalococcoidia bacterium]
MRKMVGGVVYDTGKVSRIANLEWAVLTVGASGQRYFLEPRGGDVKEISREEAFNYYQTAVMAVLDDRAGYAVYMTELGAFGEVEEA